MMAPVLLFDQKQSKGSFTGNEICIILLLEYFYKRGGVLYGIN